MNFTVVILTFNEARHIERAISSVAGIASHVLIVDSGSTDRTQAIARGLGATVLENPWRNYATQFNWALDQLGAETQWVLRLDADEIVQPELAAEIARQLPALGPEIEGAYVSRRMSFMGRVIRHGGVFPIRVLRLFRYGKGRCENRWMDEHVIVSGKTADFRGGILDDNLNSLSWWTTKHNSYASREVIDLLNLQYGFMPSTSIASLRSGQQAGVKRWIKEKFYRRLPGGMRAFLYFLYRYVLRLGFLDGFEGTAFHVMQGFWYRFLVDAKLHEVVRYMQQRQVDPVTAIDHILDIRVLAESADTEKVGR